MEEDFNTYDYTTNHHLPYPNNSQENIDLIENITKLAEAVETNLDDVDDDQTTQNEAIQANADNIATNTEDITALKAENEYLESIIDQLPSVSGTGESITLEPTIAAKLREIALNANTYQFTTKGYNLWGGFNNYSQTGYTSKTNGKISFSNPIQRCYFRYYSSSY